MRKMYSIFAIMLFAVLFTYTASADKVDDIIAKNIKAHGGEKAFTDLKDYYVEIEMSVMGMSMPMKSWNKGTEKSRVEASMMGQEMITVKNGDKIWVKAGGQVMELPPDQASQQEMQNFGNNPIASYIFLDYKKNGTKITYIGSENVNGKDCEQLKVELKNGLTMFWFFDKNTGLEAKYKFEIKTPETDEEDEEAAAYMSMMGNTIEVFIKDFMTLDGGIVAAKTIESKMGPMTTTINIKKIDMNISIDDSKFAPLK